MVAVGQLQWVQQQARIQSNSSASSSSSSSTDSSSESELDHGLAGQSVIYVGLEGRGVVGALGFSDTLRPDGQYVVQQLHSRGIRVVVLSGPLALLYMHASLCAYMRTHVHTYQGTHTHTCTHAHAHTHKRARTHERMVAWQFACDTSQPSPVSSLKVSSGDSQTDFHGRIWRVS